MPATEVITLKHHSGNAEVNVNLFGATLTSWKIFGTDMLYLSSKAALDGSAPIRGGMPVVFPHFGPAQGDMPRHGFARTSMWTFDGEEFDLQSGDCTGTFLLKSSDATRAMWPHDFTLALSVQVGLSNIVVRLTLTNDSAEPLSFQALLHTYFSIEDIDNAAVTGLAGLTYKDTARNGASFKQSVPVVVFQGEVDRVYARGHALDDTGRVRAEGLLSVGDGGNCDVVLKAVNLPDVVVWSPGAEKGAALADVGEGEWRRFVCVEAGAVSAPVSLAPGEEWCAGQNLTLRILATGRAQVQAAYGADAVPSGEAQYPKMDRIIGLRKTDKE